MSNDNMNEIIKTIFSETLFSKRTEYKLTQEAMANKCHITCRAYVSLENAKSLPSLPTFINILVICNINPNKFITKLKDIGYHTWTNKIYIYTEKRGN